MSTMTSPTSFVPYLLHYVPFFELFSDLYPSIPSHNTPTSTANYIENHSREEIRLLRIKQKLIELSNKFIHDFLLQLNSLLFAPSTIAITAVYLSLFFLASGNDTICIKFLNNIPSFLLPYESTSSFLATQNSTPFLIKNINHICTIPTPNTSLNLSTNYPNSLNDIRYFDLQSCLTHFLKLTSVRSQTSPSPTSTTTPIY